MEVTISLIALNQKNDLERLLPSLTDAARSVSSEILLVNNRSNDGGGDYVQKYHPAVEQVENQGISGYGENHNINLRRARGRYFLIMNSDMVVSADVLAVLRDFMDDHPDVGIVSPKIVNADGTVQGLNKRHPTVLDLFLRRFMPRQLRSVCQGRLDHYEMRDVGYDHGYDVPFLSGAFMFCRTDLIQRLGGFDRRYFLYFEDADLCRRVQETHRTVYCPTSVVIHYWARSAHRQWKFSFIFIKSAWRYFERWGFKWF